MFAEYGADIKLIIHTAAQPSHDWAAKDPHTDFSVNANGTLILLEATRKFSPQACFIFTSTNKVYGDNPNRLPLVELADAVGDRQGPPLLRARDRRESVGRPDQALPVRRLEACGRRHGPGVWPLLRDEHGLLSGRLPDRPRPLGHHDAWVPLVSGQVRTDGNAVHGLRLSGQAGPRQHPLVRPGQHVLGVLPGPQARRGLQRRRRPVQQLFDEGSDRLFARAAPARRWTWSTPKATGSATTSGTSATRASFSRTTPPGSRPTTCPGSSTRSSSRCPRASSRPLRRGHPKIAENLAERRREGKRKEFAQKIRMIANGADLFSLSPLSSVLRCFGASVLRCFGASSVDGETHVEITSPVRGLERRCIGLLALSARCSYSSSRRLPHPGSAEQPASCRRTRASGWRPCRSGCRSPCQVSGSRHQRMSQ